MIQNDDESRLPERDEDGHVHPKNCSVVGVRLMLPRGTSKEDLAALMGRLYEREPTVLHWATDWYM